MDRSLIDVLKQVNDFMAELQTQLDLPFSSETSRLLANKAREALSSAIAMARLLELPSVSGSPKSEGSYRASKEMERREMCKKRKSMPRWSRQVRACSDSAMEGPLNDGYSWRKYGQKDILAAKFPRGYYRCTYRNTHSCLATKHVQRSDLDSTLFDVTYRGVHTCHHCLQRTTNPSPKTENIDYHHHQLYHLHHQQQQQLLLEHLKTGLWVKTEGISSDHQLILSPSTPAGELRPQSNGFSSGLKLEDRFIGLDLQGLDAEFAEIVSSTTSATSSPMAAMDFSMEQIEFEQAFSFEG